MQHSVGHSGGVGGVHDSGGEMLHTLEVWEDCNTVMGDMLDTLVVWEECNTVMGEMLDTLEVWEELSKAVLKCEKVNKAKNLSKNWEECNTVMRNMLDTLVVWEECNIVMGEMLDTLEVWEELSKAVLKCDKVNKARKLSMDWESRRVAGWVMRDMMGTVMDRLEVVPSRGVYSGYCAKTMKRKRWQLNRSVRWSATLQERTKGQGMEWEECLFTRINFKHIPSLLQEDETTGEVCQEAVTTTVPTEDRVWLVVGADQVAGSQDVWPACTVTVSSSGWQHKIVSTNQLIGKPEDGLACTVLSTEEPEDKDDKVGTDQLVGSLRTRAACTELGTGVQDEIADTEDRLQLTPVGDQLKGLVIGMTRLEVGDILSDKLADMSLSEQYENNTRMKMDQDPLDSMVGLMSSLSLLGNKEKTMEDVEMSEYGEERGMNENSIQVDIPVEHKGQQAKQNAFSMKISGNRKTSNTLQEFHYPGEDSNFQEDGYLSAGKFRVDR